MITGLEKFGESGVFVTTLADNEKRGGLCDRGSVLYFFFNYAGILVQLTTVLA